MIVPCLKTNGKFSLYNTAYDFKKGDKNYSELSDNINPSGFDYNEFDFINPFVEGFAIAETGDNAIFIDKKGRELKTNHKYYEIRNFNGGLAPVSRNYKVDYPQWRFINKNGIEIIDDEFEEYHNNNNGYINVTKYTSYAPSGYGDFSSLSVCEFATGIIDVSGNMIIPPNKHSSFSFHKNFIQEYFSSGHNDYTNYYNYSGEKLDKYPFEQFEWIGDSYENRGISILKNKNEYVIVDDSLKIIKHLGITSGTCLGEMYTILPNKYGLNFYGRVCAIKMNEKWGLINYEGEVVLEPKYDFIGGYTDVKEWTPYSFGCAVVGKIVNSKMKYSAINSDFEEITGFQFDEIKLFNEGIASVKIGERWGAIDSLGNFVVPVEYNHISYCNNGFIEVGLGDYDSQWFIGHYGFYNKSGDKITKIIYEKLGQFNNGNAIYKKNGKFGLLNESGVEKYMHKYDNIKHAYDSFYIAEEAGFKFYIDSNGREFRFRS